MGHGISTDLNVQEEYRKNALGNLIRFPVRKMPRGNCKLTSNVDLEFVDETVPGDTIGDVVGALLLVVAFRVSVFIASILNGESCDSQAVRFFVILVCHTVFLGGVPYCPAASSLARNLLNWNVVHVNFCICHRVSPRTAEYACS